MYVYAWSWAGGNGLFATGECLSRLSGGSWIVSTDVGRAQKDCHVEVVCEARFLSRMQRNGRTRVSLAGWKFKAGVGEEKGSKRVLDTEMRHVRLTE